MSPSAPGRAEVPVTPASTVPPVPPAPPAPPPSAPPAPPPPPAAAVPTTSVSPTAGGLWRDGRSILLVAIVMIAGALAAVLLGGSGQAGRPLDPADASLSGGKGLARLLEARGVRVLRVTSVTEAVSLAGRAGPAGSTVLLSPGFPLTTDEAERLATAPSDLLLAGARSQMWLLAPGVGADGEARARSREPRCDLPAATRAGSAHLGGVTLTLPTGAVGCYPSNRRPTLVSLPAGDRTVTVTGDGAFMTNLRLAEDGNAALAVNLAGARPTLIWLTPPETGPGAAETPGFYDLVPEGVRWAVAQLLFAVLLLALWRGRRLGPVVAERLPVVVRAAETVEGRARLYRARRARDRAAAALRAGFTDRVTPRLGLPYGADAGALVNAIAERTGQAAPQVGAALYGPPPADEAGLVALAAYMDFVERQVGKS